MGLISKKALRVFGIYVVCAGAEMRCSSPVLMLCYAACPCLSTYILL